MNTELEKLFKHYDFGYDLDLISAEDWVCETNHYYRKVYLEENSKNSSSPIQGVFHIFLHDNGNIREITVDLK